MGVLTAITFSGDGSNLTGIAATNFNTQVVPGSTYSINVTNDGSGAYTLSGTDRNGSVSGNNASVSVEIGDTLNFVVDASGHPFYIRVSDGGANVSTPAATNQGSQSGTVSWTPNTAGTYYYQCGNHAGMIGTITVTATTTIDLSLGNVVKYTQSANTTVSFANTGTSNIVSFIRSGDGTITWPSAIKWDGGSAPTLDAGVYDTDANVITLLTRDEGVTWYGWETISSGGGYELWVWGGGSVGMLAQITNSDTQYSSPIQIPGNWRSVAASNYSSVCATKPDGTLWGWGRNSEGQLGQNSINTPGNTGLSSPVQIPGTTWSPLLIANDNVTAIKTDGTLWTMGVNTWGQLGQNNRTVYSSPVQIGSETTWPTSGEQKLEAIDRSTGGVKTDGTLWLWGRNSTGELGQNNLTHYSSPVQIPGTTWNTVCTDGDSCAATKTDGTAWTWGLNEYG